MGAAKKIVRLNPQANKVELRAVSKDTMSGQDNVIDLVAVAQSLTRERSLSHEEVEAVLYADTPEHPEPETGQASETPPENIPAASGTARRDMSKMALFASLVAVILLLGFYLHLNQNIKNLTQQVQDLAVIKTAVSSLDLKMNTMESKVADLETLPAKTRAALLGSLLDEMSQKTSYMSQQLDSDEQRDKLMKAKELMQQVQTELQTRQ